MTAAKKSDKYVAVGRVIHRNALAGKKEPTKTYNPGDPIDSADFDAADLERLVKKGSIKPATLAKAEDQAREQARLAQEDADAKQAEVDAQAAVASGNNVPNGTEADAAIAAGGGGGKLGRK